MFELGLSHFSFEIPTIVRAWKKFQAVPCTQAGEVPKCTGTQSDWIVPVNTTLSLILFVLILEQMVCLLTQILPT